MDVSDQEVLRQAFMQLSARLSQHGNQIQSLTMENQILTTRLAKSMLIILTRTSSSPSSARPMSLVDTRLLGKPQTCNGELQRFPDWSFKLKAYLGAIDVRYQAIIAHTEQATRPI